MDEALGSEAGNTLVLTGTGFEAARGIGDLVRRKHGAQEALARTHDVDPSPFLRSLKTRKFLSKQDRLALVAAGKAIAAAGLSSETLRCECGMFMTVGYIPFERNEADALCENSMDGGRFSMEKFSTEGYASVNPIRAFSCLPNMPAHHISANFGMQGEYFTTYPGTAEFYLAMHEAVMRLRQGSIRAALVGAVADQTNMLVENHYRKTAPERVDLIADAAAFLVLETEETARSRKAPVLARLVSIDITDRSVGQHATASENGCEFGAVDLPLKLALCAESCRGTFRHESGIGNRRGQSRWEFS